MKDDAKVQLAPARGGRQRQGRSGWIAPTGGKWSQMKANEGKKCFFLPPVTCKAAEFLAITVTKKLNPVLGRGRRRGRNQGDFNEGESLDKQGAF
jgi:hypothetical protein